MIYLDSYVFLDLFSGEKELVKKAKRYLIEARKENCAISTVVLTEVIFHLLRKKFIDTIEDFLLFIDTFKQMKVFEVNRETAIFAGKLRHKYYKKGECELSFLDCIHIATAIFAKCSKIVTGDEDFSKIEEIKVEVY
jgi:predicted nucleic acid-binding protein